MSTDQTITALTSASAVLHATPHSEKKALSGNAQHPIKERRPSKSHSFDVVQAVTLALDKSMAAQMSITTARAGHRQMHEQLQMQLSSITMDGHLPKGEEFLIGSEKFQIDPLHQILEFALSYYIGQYGPSPSGNIDLLHLRTRQNLMTTTYVAFIEAALNKKIYQWHSSKRAKYLISQPINFSPSAVQENTAIIAYRNSLNRLKALLMIESCEEVELIMPDWDLPISNCSDTAFLRRKALSDRPEASLADTRKMEAFASQYLRIIASSNLYDWISLALKATNNLMSLHNKTDLFKQAGYAYLVKENEEQAIGTAIAVQTQLAHINLCKALEAYQHAKSEGPEKIRAYGHLLITLEKLANAIGSPLFFAGKSFGSELSQKSLQEYLSKSYALLVHGSSGR